MPVRPRSLLAPLLEPVFPERAQAWKRFSALLPIRRRFAGNNVIDVAVKGVADFLRLTILKRGHNQANLGG